MKMSSTYDAPLWYVIHTNPKQEGRAGKNLMAWGIEVFFPKIKKCNVNRFNGVKTFITEPLFPRYIFAKFAADKMTHKVCYTRGVHNIVQFGDRPAPVEEEVIRLLKSQVNKDGSIKMGGRFNYGEKVVVKEGPFKNFIGIFERELPDHERVLILLTMVSYQSRVVLDRDAVGKLDHAA